MLIHSPAAANVVSPRASTESAHEPSNPIHRGMRSILALEDVHPGLPRDPRPDRAKYVLGNEEGSRLGSIQWTLLGRGRVNDVVVRQSNDVTSETVLDHWPVRGGSFILHGVEPLRNAPV